MADFVEKEAIESDDSSEDDVPKKKKRMIASDSSSSSSDSDNDDDEIPDEEELCRKEGEGWIVDEDEEDGEDENEVVKKKKRKRSGEDEGSADNAEKHDSSSDEDLDDDDFLLIKENVGVQLKKQKKRRVIVDDDDEDTGQDGASGAVVSKIKRTSEEDGERRREVDREQIARQIFEDDEEGDDSGEELTREVRTAPLQPNLDVEDEDEEIDDDDMGDFIVNERGEPETSTKKVKKVVHEDARMQEAQDIFGVDMVDLDDLAKYTEVAGDDYSDEDEEEDDYEDEEDDDEMGVARRTRRDKRALKAREGDAEEEMYQVFDPSDLERAYYSKADERIRITDIPERFQLRSVPVRILDPTAVTYKEDIEELTEEAEWIYKHAFRIGFITAQEPQSDPNMSSHCGNAGLVHKANPKNDRDRVVPHIKEALVFMREKLFEVPFIAFYRKEYVEKELDINDLWKIWQWDEKWTQLRSRKQNLTNLVRRMRDYLDHMRNELAFDQREHIPQMPEKSLKYCRSMDTLDEIHDVYTHFLLHYGDEIAKMREWEHKERMRKKAEAKKAAADKSETETVEGGEDEEEADEEDKEEAAQMRARLSGKTLDYRMGMRAGLGRLILRFGLSSENFAENMRDQYSRHEVDQCPVLPLDAAEDFICHQFPTSQTALSAARTLLATQMSSEPLVRRIVRRVFFDRAKINVRPTKKGKAEIDEQHPCYPFKYLKMKPVTEIAGDMFLQLVNASKENLLTFDFAIDDKEGRFTSSYMDEIKNFFYRDEFSTLVQSWNQERYLVLQHAMEKVLYPQLKKELHCRLLQEAYEGIAKLCARKLFTWLQVAPYPAMGGHGSRKPRELRSGGPGAARVMALAYMEERDSAAYAVMLDEGGEVKDFLKLPGVKFSSKSTRADFRKEKTSDLSRLSKFIKHHKPHVIAVGCESRVALSMQEDLTQVVNDLHVEYEREIPPIPVELMSNEPALVFQASKKALQEFPDYPPVMKQAISIGRRLQDPLIELSQLMNQDDDILGIRFHSLQDNVPKEMLMQYMEMEFINRVNEVGVDLNRAIEYTHTANLVPFISGLGPRKGFGLLKSMKQHPSKIELKLCNREDLVRRYEMTPHIAINCVGFIKIWTKKVPHEVDMEMLDGTRVHPESYELAKKMAVDALDYEDAEEMDETTALEEILESPERLRDLDLDAFAEELKRQDHGDKHITLYDIRKELNSCYKDLRQPYRPPNAEERFNMVTKETPDTFHIGRLIECQVLNVSTKKPRSDQMDNANPVRSEASGLWICPFCQQEDFKELSAVWNHFDANECMGQAVGIKVLLDNGVLGFIHTRMLSDKPVANLWDRVKPFMMIQARIIKIDIEHFKVDLTSRTSDLQDHNSKWKPPRDLYYDYDTEDQDERQEKENRQKATKTNTYVNRIIFHPDFKNITYAQFEKLVPGMDVGEMVIRPSSKGSDHLTVSWKVDERIVQHIDVVELEKANSFSLGKLLRIGDDEFEDLDEIISRHVQPMVSYVREIFALRYYRDTQGGNPDLMHELLVQEKRANPSRIPYYVTSSVQYPGKFILFYMPSDKTRTEYISVTPDAFRFRGQMFDAMPRLISWFKAHFSDPLNSNRGPGGRSSAAHTPMIGTTPDMNLGTPASQAHYRTPTNEQAHRSHDPRQHHQGRHTTPNTYLTPTSQHRSSRTQHANSSNAGTPKSLGNASGSSSHHHSTSSSRHHHGSNRHHR